MKVIGITNIDPWFMIDDSDSLKNELIYCDELLYTIQYRETLEKFCFSLPRGKEIFEQKIKEIELLENSGLIHNYSKHKSDNFKFSNLEEIIRYKERALELSSSFTTKGKDFKELFVDFLDRFREVAQLNARASAIEFNNSNSAIYIPIIRNQYDIQETDKISMKANVLSIVLKKFPTISNKTDINKLIDFKNDPDTNLKISRLRDWTNEISRKNYSVKEIEQKIDYLLSEYTAQIEIHKIKYELGNLETLITTTLEILENIVKLNFSKVAKTIFEVKNRKVDLLEAEQKLTGKELALIYTLKEKNCL